MLHRNSLSSHIPQTVYGVHAALPSDASHLISCQSCAVSFCFKAKRGRSPAPSPSPNLNLLLIIVSNYKGEGR